jgi:dihydrofolate reductase
MKIAIIVATDNNRLIGKDNDLPWKLSADLQYFKRVTMGKPLIMGRKTHESIGRPLPGRKNIIITGDEKLTAEGCVVVNSIDAALAECADVEEVMVMGGASLYEQFLPIANKLYLTRVDAELTGDTWFPEWQTEQWLEVEREDHQADEKNQFDYSFIVYEKLDD